MSNYQTFINSAATSGYVSTPIKTLEWLKPDGEFTFFEAFFQLIAKVNFKDREVEDTQGRKRICHQGESIRSIETWSRLFSWETEKTERFFEMLRDFGALEEIDNPITANHIRIAQYAKLTGRVKPTTEEESFFETFWKLYHQITRMKPAEKARAKRKWDNMTNEQQDRAVEGIQSYYDSLTDKKYCRKAATYLEQESFEF